MSFKKSKEKQMFHFLIPPNYGRAVQMGGLGVVFKVSGSQTGGSFSIVEHPIAPGTIVLRFHNSPRFHVRMNVAPLKRAWGRSRWRLRCLFPRSNERGPIEAGINSMLKYEWRKPATGLSPRRQQRYITAGVSARAR
jgi:hypothetical protein